MVLQVWYDLQYFGFVDEKTKKRSIHQYRIFFQLRIPFSETPDPCRSRLAGGDPPAEPNLITTYLLPRKPSRVHCLSLVAIAS